MFRKHLAWLLLLQLVFVLGGCGGGSDSVPPPQISVRSVDVLQEGTIEPKSVTAMSVTLSSDADFADLAVAFYLVSGDEEAGEPELFYFGGAVIPAVASGENAYLQSFVFSDDVPAGTYRIAVHLDPLGTTLPRDIMYFAPDDVTARIGTDRGKPDLVLHDIRPDSSYLLLLQDDETGDGVRRDNLSATIDVESVAHGAENVTAMAYIETTAGYEPVRIWNPTVGAFAETFTIPSLGANSVQSVALDLLVPEDVRARLAGMTQTNVKIVVDPLDAIDENEDLMVLYGREDDNELVEPVNIFAGTPVASKGDGDAVFETSFSKGFDNKFFGAKVDFRAKAWFSGKGIGSEVSGATPVTVLSHTFDFLGVTSSARYNPVTPTDSGFDLDVEFAGATVYSKHGDAGFTWEQTWQVEKSKGFDQRFVIAIVPVKVSAGVSGTLGFRAAVNVGSAFNGTVSPFVDIGTYVSAGVDAFVAKAGVRGNLHLIKFDLGTTLGGTIAADAGATQLTGTLDGNVGYTLTGPKGEIVIYVGYPWCCKWWIICKPCTKDAEWTLVSWSPYSKSDTLLDKHQSVTVPLK